MYQTRTVERRGPFGMFKRQKQTENPVGTLEEGGTVDLKIGEEVAGIAMMVNGALQLEPRLLGFVIDSGGTFALSVSATVANERGEQVQIPIGRLTTRGDATLRRIDESQSFVLKRVP